MWATTLLSPWGVVRFGAGSLQGPNFAIAEAAERRATLTDEAIGEAAGRLGIGVARVTTEFELLYANQAYADIIGRPDPAAIVGKVTLAWVHPEDRRGIYKMRAELYSSPEGRAEFEVRLVRPDGEIRTARASVVTEQDRIGQNLVMLWDETDQRRRMEEQEAAASSLADLINSLGIGLVRNDADGVVREVNQAMVDILDGDRPESFVGRHMSDWVRDQAPEILEQVRVATERGEVYTYDTVTYTEKGEPRYVSVSRGVDPHDPRQRIGFVIDRTRRRVLEQEREAALARLTRLADAANVGIMRAGADDRVIEANLPYARMAGFEKPEDLIGRHVAVWLAPERRQEIGTIRRRVYDGETLDLRTEFLGPDGVRRIIAIDAMADGDVGERITFARDITQAEQNRRDLEEAQQRFEMLADRTETGFWRLSADNIIVEANDALARILGYDDASALVGTSATDLVPEFERPRMAAFRQKVRETGAAEARHAFIGANGDLVTIQSNAAYDPETGGRITFMRDVGEEERLKAALVESVERFELLTDRTDVGVWIISPDGRLTEANAALARMLGYSRPEALIGKTPEMLIDSAEGPGITRLRATVARDGAATARFRMPGPGGAPLIVANDAVRLKDGGRIGFLRDVTHEEQLLRDLAQRNSDLEHFSAAVSHDLRAPLRKIGAYADLLAADLPDDIGASATDDINVIRAAAARMRSLLDAVGALIGVGQGDIVTETVDIEAEARAAFEMLDAPADATLSVSGDAHMQADSRLIRQYFDNVLGNAVKYRRRDRPLQIEISVDHLSAYRTVISVDDNGPGIPQYQREAALAPFKRLRTDTQQDGSGLGLAICNRIVQHYDGEIKIVDSSMGGAKVRADFALARPPGGGGLFNGRVEYSGTADSVGG